MATPDAKTEEPGNLSLNRERELSKLRGSDSWDLLIVGGGAAGLGTALAATLHGHRVLLLERDDWAEGTSSRSTKLVHGGVRYLPQGRISLLRESLRERRSLLEAAPGWVRDMPIVLPTQSVAEAWKYRAGLTLYESLAGSNGLGPVRRIDQSSLADRFPGIQPEFSGGIEYHDARFDDARFAVAVAHAIVAAGGTVLNGFAVTSLQRDDHGRVSGVIATDVESDERFSIASIAVVNATGPVVNQFRTSHGKARHDIRWSRGSHLVLDQPALPRDVGMLVPKTEDGRVLFVLPWHGKSLVGTTDIGVDGPDPTPRVSVAEAEYLLGYVNRYFGLRLGPHDVRSAFAGLRTLVGSGGEEGAATASLSRESVLELSEPGLLSILGGKWTTFKSQGERAIQLLQEQGGLPRRDQIGNFSLTEVSTWLGAQNFAEDPFTQVDAPTESEVARFVRFAVEHQMARTPTDVLARRSRVLFVDRARSDALLPAVLNEMGRVFRWTGDDRQRQESLFARYRDQFEIE